MPSEITLLRPDLAWHQAAAYSTNTLILLNGGQALIIDPGISPSDFERLTTFLEPYPLVAGLVTHAHWDHFLWDARLGPAVPRYALAATLTEIQARFENNEAQMREIEALNTPGKELWPRNLLYQEQALAEGPQRLGNFDFEIYRLDGHCRGSAAFLFADYDLLVVGDHLSDLEVPSLDDEPQALAAYLQTLNTLEGLLERASLIIPGHGSPADREEAQARLEADRRYLQALAALTPEDLRAGLDQAAQRVLESSPDPRAESEWGQGLHQANLDHLLRFGLETG